MPKKASKLLEHMRQSAANWTRHDLDALYLGYGFNIRAGGNHDIARHPTFPQLRATLPRHAKDLAKGYISQAVKLIDQLEKLEGENRGGKKDE